MIEIICNVIYTKSKNYMYRVNNEACIKENGHIRHQLAVASPLACPIQCEVEVYVGNAYDDRYGYYDEFEYQDMAPIAEYEGWYDMPHYIVPV